MSYEDLSQQVREHAALLLEQGVKPGDLAAVISPSSFTIFRILYAALCIRIAIFPIDPAMVKGRRDRLLAQAGCDLMISDTELDDLPDGMNVIPSTTSGVINQLFLDQVREIGSERNEVQLVIATSGSEGEPKGVMLSGENITASVSVSRNRLGLESNDLWLNCLPLFHIGGLSILYRCLDAGAGVLLHQGFDANAVWADLTNHDVTHISLVPAMLVQLLDVSEGVSPPKTLRVALIGGGHLSPELARQAHTAGWPICVSYGMSETASQCATACGDQAGLASGMVGLPLDGFEIALSKHNRIKVRGPAVMRGYVNPDRKPGDGIKDGGWFKTSDIGEMDESGRLRVLGRADDVLISAGKTIHPLEAEGLIIDCPGVDAVAVTGRKDQAWGDVLVALYTGAALVDEVEVWCRANISSNLRPRSIIRVSELPYNGMGKLDRKELKEIANQS